MYSPFDFWTPKYSWLKKSKSQRYLWPQFPTPPHQKIISTKEICLPHPGYQLIAALPFVCSLNIFQLPVIIMTTFNVIWHVMENQQVIYSNVIELLYYVRFGKCPPMSMSDPIKTTVWSTRMYGKEITMLINT